MVYAVLHATEHLIAIGAQDPATTARTMVMVKVQATMPANYLGLMLAADRTSAELAVQDSQVFFARSPKFAIAPIPDCLPDARTAPSRFR